MDYKKIIDGIEYWLTMTLTSYPDWTIGVSDEPNRRSAELIRAGQQIPRWRYFPAEDVSAASAIESYFLERGMRADNGDRGEGPTYVYIY